MKNQKNKTTKTKQAITKTTKIPKEIHKVKKKTKNKKETHSISPKYFSHVFYLFPYQKLVDLIHLRC